MKKSFITYIFLFTCLLVIVGCAAEFEEINTNPNQTEEVLPQLLMPNIIRTVVSEQVGNAWSPGNLVVQYSAQIRDPGTDRYVWGSFSGLWNTMYNILRDVNNLEQLGQERDESNYIGIALVMKSWIYQVLTDSYGDIPYSQAQQGKSNRVFFVPYDRQEAIYEGMLADLERANELLNENGGIINGDILFDGDYMKWRKLANSLRLRLLVRRSNQVEPGSEIQNIINNPAQFPIMESNEDNAALAYLSETPNLFPIANTREGSWLDRRLSKTLADELNAIEDPRLPIFAQPTENSVDSFQLGLGPLKWRGVRNGEEDENLSSDIDRNVSQLGSIYYIRQGTAVPAEGLIMSYAEVQFILAEAAAKGWASGDAEAYYLEGIQASVDYYAGVAGTTVQVDPTYFEQEAVAFNPDNALEQIGLQKWIALYFNGLEGWFEWRRTGFPDLQPAIVNSNNDQIPVRFQYPLDQQTLNPDNYQQAVSNQGLDDINTKVWWDQD